MTRILALIVLTLGLLVKTVGWLGEAEWLLSIFPHWVTMKASTAVSFALLGTGLFAADMRGKRRGIAHGVMTSVAALVMVLMSGLALQSLTGLPIGFDDVFVAETKARLSVAPGVPSLATIFLDMLCAICLLCMSETNDQKRCRFVSRVTALIAGGMAGTALAGYALDVPTLYWHFPGVSTAMAVHTAVGFALVGCILWRLSTEQE